MSTEITVLIADDEEYVCSDLRYILDKDPRVRIVGVCSAGDEALDSICKDKPDIVFLDINMPRLNGIQLGRYLKTIKYPLYLVYVTAYSEFAVDAFKVGAKGYLMKPFSTADVLEQIDLALEALGERQKPVHRAISAGRNERVPRIAVELEGKYQLLEQQKILVAFAQSRTVFLRANDRTYTTRFLLAELESRLQPDMFMRCHRNYIVNLNHIKEIIPWFHSTYILVLDDDKTRVPISRVHVSKLKEMFHF